MTEQLNQTTQKKAASLPQNQSKKSSQNRRKRNRSEFSANKTQAKTNFYPKKKVEFDSSKFFYMYGKGDLPLGMEIGFVDKNPIFHTATTISQARGVLRAKIRELGGNAAGYLTEERRSVAKTSWSYAPAKYEVGAYPTLVYPKDLPSKDKEELLARFKANVEQKNHTQTDGGTPDNYQILAVLILVLFVGLVALTS